jgi:hypothetical protein
MNPHRPNLNEFSKVMSAAEGNSSKVYYLFFYFDPAKKTVLFSFEGLGNPSFF